MANLETEIRVLRPAVALSPVSEESERLSGTRKEMQQRRGDSQRCLTRFTGRKDYLIVYSHGHKSATAIKAVILHED